MHLGSVRTALYCWLYARHHDGQFILRIEDTDPERSTEENVDAILDGLAWLGLNADQGPFYQTQRFSRYREVMDQWLSDGKAYHCYCSKEELAELREKQMNAGDRVRYDGRCRNRAEPRKGVDPVVRFKNPLDGEVVVDDLVRGRVVFENVQLDDLVIARSDGSPTYNFSVIIDDHDMEITHVIRGDDHLNNTPRQMNMLAAMGAEPPTYAHLPMILGPDGTIVPDLKEKLPGRGVWLTAAHDTVAEAVKRKAFGRALKAEAKASDALADQIDKLLTEAALASFAMANKAGEVVFGHSKAEEALAKGRVVALVHAADAAEDGCRKLDGKAMAATEGRRIPAVCTFSGDELSLASGRTNVIHAALIQGGAARKFLAAASRIERYRKGSAAFLESRSDTDKQ